MTTEERKDEVSESEMKTWQQNHRRGKIAGGLLIIAAGVLFLARELEYPIYEWIFTWQMLLITIGLVIGFKHNFRQVGWFVMVLIGVAFLLKEYTDLGFSKYIWPIAIIVL